MTKTKRLWQFPQIFRGFPAKSIIKAYFYRFFLGIMILGVFFLLILNLYVSYMQPYYLKKLLQNPKDISALKTVLIQNQQPQLDIFLKKELLQLAGQKTVDSTLAQKQQQTEAIVRLEKLLQQYPSYPDGHALLAVWYYRQSYCQMANSAINQAIELDPNRMVFYQLKAQINDCLP